MNEYRGNYKDRPVLYWVFMLCLGFWIFVMIIALFGGFSAFHVSGASTHHADDASLKQWGQDTPYNYFARGINNRWYHSYLNESKGFNLTWSDNNGSTWSKCNIIELGWESSSDIKPRGMVVSSNNQSHVIFTVLGVSGYDQYSLWLAYNITGNQSSWSYECVADNAAEMYQYIDIAINDTDKVLISYVWQADNHYYKIFDALTDTLGGQQNWENRNSIQIKCAANVTGKFWFCFIYWDGAKWILNHRDLEKSESIVSSNLAALGSYYLGSYFAFGNNRMGITYGYYLSSTSTYYAYYAYGWTSAIAVKKLKQTANDITSSNVAGMADEGNMAYIIYYDIDNDHVYQFHQYWNATEGDWQATEAVLYTPTGASDRIWVGEGPIGYYPLYPNGQQASAPDSGYMHQWQWKDEIGATDDYYWSIHWNATFNWYDWSPPEEPPEEPPDENGEIDWSVPEIDLLGNLWILLAALAIIVCIFRSTKRIQIFATRRRK